MCETDTRPRELWSNRELVQLVWPLAIERLLVASLGIIDTVMVAYLGEEAVSGISLVDIINIILIDVFTSLATGGTVVCSQYLGRRDGENASRSAEQLIYTVTAISFAVSIFGVAFHGPILRLLYGQIAPGVMESAQTYFWISAISYPFVGIYNVGNALFRSTGNSRVGMATSFLSNILKVGGNLFFMSRLNMGVAGAAVSMVICRAASAAMVMILLYRSHDGPLRIGRLFPIRLRWDIIRGILKVGVPTGLEGGMFQMGKLFLVRLVTTFGTAAIAGNAFINIIMTLGNIPGISIALCMLTVVAQCVGAGDNGAARRYARKLVLASYGAMTVANVVIALLLRPAFSLLSISGEAMTYAFWGSLVFCIAAIFLWTLAYCLPYALRAVGDGKYTMCVSACCMWMLRVGSAYFVAHVFGLGMPSIWIGMVLEWTARAIVYLTRWKSGKWEANRVLAD